MPRLVPQLVHLAIAFVEVILVLRFVLKLLGASAQSGVVASIYGAAAPFIQPFLFAFPTPAVGGRFVIEFTTLFAIFAYAVIGYILQEILEILVRKK